MQTPRRPRPSRARQDDHGKGLVVRVDPDGAVAVLPWFAMHRAPGQVEARMRMLLDCSHVDRVERARVAGLDVSVWTDADAVIDGRDPNLAMSVTLARAVHGPAILSMPVGSSRPVGLSAAGAQMVASAFTARPVQLDLA